MGDNDELVDARAGDRADAAQEDQLAGQAHELLRHLGAEAVARSAGKHERVNPHQLCATPSPINCRGQRIAGRAGSGPVSSGAGHASPVKPLVALRATLVRLAFLVGRFLAMRPRVVPHRARAWLSGNLAWIRDGLRAARPDVDVVVLTHLGLAAAGAA